MRRDEIMAIVTWPSVALRWGDVRLSQSLVVRNSFSRCRRVVVRFAGCC